MKTILKIYNFFKLFSLNQKLRFYLLSFITVISSSIEIFNIYLIFQFVHLISGLETSSSLVIFLEKNNYLFLKDIFTGVQSFGLFLVASLFIGLATSSFLIYASSRYSLQTGAEISNTLLAYYINKNFLFHMSTTPANIINKVKEQTSNVAAYILEQLALMISKLIFIIPLFIGLFIYNPKVTLIAGLLFISIYFIIFSFVKKKFNILGQNYTDLTKKNFDVMIDSLGGIKDIKFNSKENFFLKKFFDNNTNLVNVSSKISILNRFPKYIIEFIAISFVILLIIFFSKNLSVNFQELVVLLSIFLISSYKILPALQQIYTNIGYIKTGLPSLDGISEDFKNALKIDFSQKLNMNLINQFSKFKKVQLKNVTFSYENTKFKTLQDVSLEVNRGEKIGITGYSGSGKSTLIHLLSGLINQSEGKILIDNFELKLEALKEWRKVIGFVSQSIYLSNVPLENNIAFGRENADIDDVKISKVSDLANLKKLIKDREKSVNDNMGYRGSRLSGGQKQRVGIARAFYSDPSMLILDEATSSLDNLTEEEVLSSIKRINSEITLIMVTHKINLIKNFDKIIFLKNGKIADKGKFDNLYRDNQDFKELVDIEEKKLK